LHDFGKLNLASLLLLLGVSDTALNTILLCAVYNYNQFLFSGANGTAKQNPKKKGLKLSNLITSEDIEDEDEEEDEEYEEDDEDEDEEEDENEDVEDEDEDDEEYEAEDEEFVFDGKKQLYKNNYNF
jgi:hypothetical protein